MSPLFFYSIPYLSYFLESLFSHKPHQLLAIPKHKLVEVELSFPITDVTNLLV